MLSYIKILFSAFFSIIALFVLTKLTGNKQVSQLSMFDYINGISIGSIAAEMAIHPDGPIKPLLAMIVYAFASAVSSFACIKSIKIRRLIFGRSKILFLDGVLYRKALKKSKIDLSEFLMQCRSNGYFDLSELKAAVMEPSGRISFLPLAAYRPATPNDLKITTSPQQIKVNVIMDGVIEEKNLRAIKRDTDWLFSEMANVGINHANEVFLATASADGICTFFRHNNDDIKNDIYE